MKIKTIKTWKKELGNKRPYTIAFKTIDEVASSFAYIELEDGTFGLGAGNPSSYVTGETLDSCMEKLALDNLDFLIGRDIRELHSILSDIQQKLPKNPAARATLDIAIYDVFTKWIGVPLCSFLGQKIKSMPTSVTIGIKNVADTLEEAQEYYDLGFLILKVKTGSDVNEDIERMCKLREKFGKHFKIRVDANQGYTEANLRDFYSSTSAMDIELIEQPTPAKEIQLLKSLDNEIKDVIAADESLLSPKDAFLLAEQPRASGIFNIKLMKSGGIYPALQIATIASASGIDLMWGCNDESAISISAALHTAFSCANTKYIDLDGSLDLIEDVVSGGFLLDDGMMRVNNEAGLGVKYIE